MRARARARIRAEEAVVVPPDQRQGHQDAQAPDGADQPALERIEMEALLEVEIAQYWDGEQAESDGREGDQAHLDGADAQDPLEGGLHGWRRRTRIIDDLAQTPCFSN